MGKNRSIQNIFGKNGINLKIKKQDFSVVLALQDVK